MKNFRRIFCVLLGFALLLAGVGVSAHDVPDFERRASITLNMTFDGSPVPGGSLTYYKVGEVTEDDGNYYFALSADYKASGVTLSASSDELGDPEVAKALGDYIASAGIKGTTVDISSTGTVVLSDLEIGLYLLTQEEPAEGFNPIAPALVSLPMVEKGVYLYDVDASPKIELERAPETKPPETDPDDKLPQTGQLNWPVPVLVVSGLFLVLLGALLLVNKKKKNEA